MEPVRAAAEVSLHDQVIARIGELADERSLKWVYFPSSVQMRGHRGFPDLLVAGSGGVAFAEIKTGTSLEQGQILWRDVLQAGGACAWCLWQPVSLHDGTVTAELDRLAVPWQHS
jgi:hypothetical protein